MPFVLLLLFLLVPQSWFYIHNPPTVQHVLNIELVQDKAEIQTPQAAIIQPPKRSKIITESAKEQPLADSAPPKIKPPDTNTNITVPNTKPLSAHDVKLMMSNTKDLQLNDADFSARVSQQRFIPQQIQTINWRNDLPYLDESVDAPRLQMQFYSAGFMGNIERFFDKVTFEKTFTTKYGTKIKCALIGVVALCGWK